MLRTILVSSLAVVGVLVAVPSMARADEAPRGQSAHVSQDRDRDRDHSRVEREGRERESRESRERAERERVARERGERERFERERLERERQQERVCGHAYESGASPRALRELGCYVR